MWYLRQAKPQISLDTRSLIRAFTSSSRLIILWLLYTPGRRMKVLYMSRDTRFPTTISPGVMLMYERTSKDRKKEQCGMCDQQSLRSACIREV